MRATYTRTGGVRHLFAAYDLGRDRRYGHIKPRKTRTRFLEFATYLRTLYAPETRSAATSSGEAATSKTNSCAASSTGRT
jgi:hypothetical protein